MKRKLKKFLEMNDNENITILNLWDAAKAVWEVYSNTVLSPETEKHRIDNLTLQLKQLEKEEVKNPN